MCKKIGLCIMSGILLLNIYGCLALLAGTAVGAGTAVWLSGKLTQEVHTSYERAVSATDSALRSLDIDVREKESQADVTQFRGKYTDGKEIWIDVRKVTESSSKIEVRVGAVSPDKAAADKIMKRIIAYL